MSSSSSESPSVYTESSSEENEATYPDDRDPTLIYWRKVTGDDLRLILRTMNYDNEAIHRFLQYFMFEIPPSWGFRTTKHSTAPHQTAPSLNLDTSPVKIGLTFTSKQPNPIDRPPVRVIAEVDHLTARIALRNYCRRNDFHIVHYNMGWPTSLYGSIMRGAGSTFFGDVRVGFDIRPALRRRESQIFPPPKPGPIPVDATVYLLATRKAQHQGVTRWALIRQAILDLPGIDDERYQMRRISSGVQMVDDFLAGYPPEFGNLISIVDVGPEEPDKARIGLTFTIPAGATTPDFEEVWNWLTLGGRITKQEGINDRVFTQAFYDWAADGSSDDESPDDESPAPSEPVPGEPAPGEPAPGEPAPGEPSPAAVDLEPYLDRAHRARAGTLTPQVAPCSVYFTLAAKSEEPTATLRADVIYGSRPDCDVAQSVDGFLDFLNIQKPQQLDGSYPSLVRHLFPHLPLVEDPSVRLHTSVSFRSQGDAGGDNYTLRACYNPLYYQFARPEQ